GVAWWPKSVKGAVARALLSDAEVASKLGRKLISDLAPHVNVNGLRTTGDYGDIISSPHDLKVFAKYAAKGRWAERVAHVVGAFFDARGGGSYIDIGANIGLTTIPIARRGNVSCLAAEPDPTNFRNLTANVALNCPHGKVTLHQRAIFDRDDLLDFELCEGNLGDHRIRASAARPGALGEDKRKVVQVKATTLDGVVSDAGSPLAVKIDTQGCEPFVFDGGRRTLAKAELIHFEWWPYSTRRLNGDPRIVTEFLLEHFRSGQVVGGEAADQGDDVPIADLCDQLLAHFERSQHEPMTYFDAIVKKELMVARA
ncbi:MAG: FkbM family methyltransferase, partial [Beijerinckiaceae bacterium]